MKRKLIHSVSGAILTAMVIAGPATAKSWVDNVSAKTRVAASVIKDDMVLMRTELAFKEVRVANADIADVVVLTDKSFQVMGKKSGKTNVMLYDAQKRLVDIVDVTVGFDVAGLKKTLFETFPKDNIEVRTMAGGIYLSGDVSNDAVARQAEKIAEAYAPKRVTNGLSIHDSHQVMLEVRFVEATRDAVKELGIGLLTQRAGDFAFQSGTAIANPVLSGVLQGGFGRATLDTSIQALEEKGVIRTLAEPNLVSMSGETASFLAGGEFPIPVPADDGQIGIEFRQFGVGLAFTPTVLDDGIINLKVAPEVSQLDSANGVSISGTDVPALRVRRANTTIELRNDQSFAIAGLLQNETSNRKSQTPWIGDVPILGSLFRSSRYQKAETELVIIVTPRLVQPASDISELATPLDRLSVPGDIESFIGGALEGPVADSGGLSGTYGYARE
ncbi:type II and III secretion system protein family protein [Hellea sp.]|nr:type II and III secretion system protein family protein [Hellea sp.]